MENMITNFFNNINREDIIRTVVVLVIFIIYNICCPIFSYIIIKMFNLKEKKEKIKEHTFYQPLKEFFRITGLYLIIVYLKSFINISDNLMQIITKIYKIIVTITLANSFANSITKKSRLVLRVKEKSTKEIDDNSIKFVVRFIKTIIYITAAFIVIAEIGYDLSGLVTGLGLGSVVLTLAAQDTIKNLLGGVIVWIDKPFKVGDFIKVGDYQGTVEDVTFRSTKIRTLEDSIVQIPNALLTSDSIENISKMKRRRYNLELMFVLETKEDEIELFEKKVKEMLIANEYVYNDTIWIHFNKIEDSGFNISIIAYLNIVDYAEFLDIQEEINKNMMKIINGEKLQLAYNTSTIEIKK